MRKKVRKWITLMLAVAMIAGAVNNDFLITRANESAGGVDVSGNDVSGSDVSGNEEGDVEAGIALLSEGGTTTEATGRYYTFKDVTRTGGYNYTEDISDAGVLTVGFTGQYKEIQYSLPSGVDAKTLKSVELDVTDGETAGLAMKIYIDGTQKQVKYNSASITVDEATQTLLQTAESVTIGIMNNASDAADYVIANLKITAVQTGGSETKPSAGGDEGGTTAEATGRYYTFKDVTRTGGYNYTEDISDAGVLTVGFTGQYKEIQYSLPSGVDAKTLKSVELDVTDGETAGLAMKIYIDGTQKQVKYNSASITVDEATQTLLQTAESVTIGIMNNASDAADYVIANLKITAVQTGGSETKPSAGGDEGGTTAEATGRYYTFKDVTRTGGYNYTEDISDAGVLTVGFTGQYKEIQYSLPSGVDAKTLKSVELDVTDGETAGLAMKIYIDGTQKQVKYNSASITVDEATQTLLQTAESVTIGIMNNASAAADYVIANLKITAVQTGGSETKPSAGESTGGDEGESGSTTNVTPAAEGDEDKRFTYKEGGLTFASKSEGVTYEAKETEKVAVTLPSAWDEIKFALPENIDLSKCNSVTFAASEQSVPMSFKLYDTDGNEITALSQYSKTGTTKVTITGRTETVSQVAVMVHSNDVVSSNTCVFDGVLFDMVKEDEVVATGRYYTFNDVTNAGGYGYTETISDAGVLTVGFTGQYQEVRYSLPAGVDATTLKNITLDVTGGNVSDLAIKILVDGTQKQVAYSTNSIDVTEDLSGGTVTFAIMDRVESALSGIVIENIRITAVQTGGSETKPSTGGSTGGDEGEGGDEGGTAAAATGRYYTFKDVTKTTGGWGSTPDVDGDTGALSISFSGQYAEARYSLPVGVDVKTLEAVALDVTEGTATDLALKIYIDGTEKFVKYNTATIVLDEATKELLQTAESVELGIMNQASDAADYVIASLKITAVQTGGSETKPGTGDSGEGGVTAEATSRYYTFKDVTNAGGYGYTEDISDAGVLTAGFTGQYQEVRYSLPRGVDATTLKNITLDVTSDNVSSLAIKILVDGTQKQVVYETNSIDVTGDLSAGTVTFAIMNKAEGALNGVVIENIKITAVQTGGSETKPSVGGDSTPAPAPETENKTKPVSEGNTGIALPGLSSNMNSYYRSSNVTYDKNAVSGGVHTITYPEGYNQIQFTLSNPLDLTQYNKITFAVEGATGAVKFGLHYWSEETNTIDLWTSASTEPNADGYYTFDLNPELLTSGTTATTISVWSNGSAQTLKFHGVTFENDPQTVFESTYEITYTANQLTTSSGAATLQNGAWVVAFQSQDQDVTFNIPEVLNMEKCQGMTLNFSSVNGPVNFYVAKDNNKLESYWNIQSGTGQIQGSSITCTNLINQIGVQAGRESNVFVAGTTITLTGITFLMSGTRLETPVTSGSNTSCSVGCFDFSAAVTTGGVTVRATLSDNGETVLSQEITFEATGASIILEIPDSVDVRYLRRILFNYDSSRYVSQRAAGRDYGVTIDLLNGNLEVIASADAEDVISLSSNFTGARYIRFTSVGPTVMNLTGVTFTTEEPIVLNGSFEDADVSMWGSALWGSATIAAESASENIVGNVSTYGRIYDRISPYNGFAQDITARVQKGKIYKFAFWAKLSDQYADAPANQREITFSPYYVDENGVEQYGLMPGGTYKQSLTAGQWTYFEGTVVIPYNAERFVIRIVEQGTNYGNGSCIMGEYCVTGITMWETDREDPKQGGGGGGGSYRASNARTVTKTATCEVSYNPKDLTVSWASATTETVENGVKISFKNNYDEARLKLTQKLDMSKCAFLKVYTADQTVPIAIKLYKSGVEVGVDYYNNIEGSYTLVPTYEGYIDAIGIMSLATPNPAGASVTVTGITFGMTEEPAPYVASGDIVLNGDFADEDLSDWMAAFWDQGNGVSITQEISATPIYGNVCTYATYSRRTSPYQCFAQDITERVEQNETYTFSFWAKLSDDYKGAPSEQRVVQFAPYTVDKDGNANYNPRLDGTYSRILEPGVWTYFEGTYKVTNDNPISQVVIRILEQGTEYGKGDCVKGSYSIAGVKMERFIPEPPSIDEDVPNLYESLCETFGDDFLTGTALGIGEVDDIGVEMLVNKHFNAVTIGNELKPDALFSYSNGQHTALKTIEFNGQSLVVPTLNYSKAEEILDKILEWNEENPDKQIKVRGHVLVWHSQTPEWFFREDYTVGKNADGTENYVTPEEMNLRLEWYIKTVLEHFLGEDSPYKDLFYGWDVVNEAVADGSKGYRTDKVSATETPSDDTHGSNSSWWAVYQSNEFIIKAFQYANKYAPADVELYYNDYNETDSGKVKGIVTLLKDVLAADGTRIDAMGMQGHYNISYPAMSDIEKAIRAYAEVVGTVQITELDLKAGRDISSDRERENEYKSQAERYHKIFQLLKKLDAEDGIDIGAITFWGVVDKYSWLQTASNVGGGSDGSLTQCPLLFDSDYKVKPAFWAFVDYTMVDPDWVDETAQKEEVKEEASEEKPAATPEPDTEVSEESNVPVDNNDVEIEKDGLSVGAIIGICIAVLAVAGGGAALAIRGKKKKKPTEGNTIK